MSLSPSPDLGPVATSLWRGLTDSLDPIALDIFDESHKHAGHSAQARAGESHFQIRIVSRQFSGLNRVARQRRVNAAVADLLAGPIHALSIQALAPDEA